MDVDLIDQFTNIYIHFHALTNVLVVFCKVRNYSHLTFILEAFPLKEEREEIVVKRQVSLFISDLPHLANMLLIAFFRLEGGL